MLFLSGACGLLAVMLGAFAAHGLEKRLDPVALKIYKTAVDYHFYHTLALGMVSFFLTKWDSAFLKGAAWCFVSGILVFSGSLYLLAITGLKQLGAIAPVGGVLFLAGWICVLLTALWEKGA